MDYNSHMANTSYLDRAADVRMMYFAENGFTAEDMLRMRIGPVIMKDEIEYFREVRLLQEIRVSLALSGLAPDGSRFMLRNEIAHADGARCAVVTSTGGWLDLNARKLIVPPEPLRRAMEALPRIEGFREMKSSVSR
jgi:acyl-CoA thioester hydrolase